MENKKSKNGKLPVWAIVLIIISCVGTIGLLFGFCYLIYIDEAGQDLEDVKPVVSNAIYDEYNEAYIVSGYITNNFDEDYYDVEVYYTLYDEDNNVLGYAYDYIEWVEEGDTWKFSCEYYGLDSKDVYRVELKEVLGW